MAATRSERIYQFTNESVGNLPTHPRPMTRAEVLFLVKMNLEELMELLATVVPEEEGVRGVLVDIAQNKAQLPSTQCYAKGKSREKVIEDQVDALVDIDYYNGNGSSKVGFNMDQIFDVVHDANMNKKGDDGKFHRNEEGKIIKPLHWKEGDCESVVNRWVTNGTWAK